MIIQSLYRYYQLLVDDPSTEIALPGYSTGKVHFALNLSPQGELLDIFPYATKDESGKKIKEIPYRLFNVPEQVKRSSSIKANFLCDNTTYVLGISDRDEEKPDYSRERYDAFCKLNLDLLSKANSPAARAVIAFLETHDPQTAREHPVIARHLEGLLKGGNLIFLVAGKDILNDPEIQRVWGDYEGETEGIKMQCLVTGNNEPVARLHPSIKGVRDAQSSGASLVSFNERAYESYNRTKEQGLNSPTSERVASGYGVALNYLLSDQNPNRKIFLGDTTVVYWAESPEKRYAETIAFLFDPQYSADLAGSEGSSRQAAEEELRSAAQKVQKGQALDLEALRAGLDAETRFYVLGLAPNASRLSVRFFLTEPFGVFVERIMQHYEDLKIEKEYPDQPDYLSPYRILAECVSPKVTRRNDELKASWGLLGGALMRAILTNAPYPDGLYTAILNRIRIDSDESGGRRKINYVRAAVLKACLLRKYRRQSYNPYQEVLQMSLNEQFSNPAYVLGRLFAWLERAQKAAIGQNINATIKDRYFTSACASPASVFPTLLRLSQHYFSKAEYGGYLENQIEKLLDLLEAKPFPPRLSLDEQGVFVLGYYHQRAAFFTKDSDRASDTVETNHP